ncbi:unnamed protein product [Lactuca virosa]|uniref:F-box domain-containing protein n=1 Tax=Lactuca virosa TaxID=75947 RepID=A0AAU9N0M8_9ASTR|nr:unnamed protein product [Lactuca virosa]
MGQTSSNTTDQPTGMAKTRSMTRNQNHDDDDASSKKKMKACIFCVGIAKTRSMIRNRNHNDPSSKKKRINKTCDTWSDLNHDVLFIIMMQLGVDDYVSFSRVCKSWRSLAVCNKNKFIVSRPPMSLFIPTDDDDDEKKCHLEDFEGRKFKFILPHSAGRICIGATCGYLILCGKGAFGSFFANENRDFWLVNPITRHELHFPFPFPNIELYFHFLGAILVFSPCVSGWVFVVFYRRGNNGKIWFCIAGKREWTSVSTVSPIIDLRAFKGKIYTLYTDNRLGEVTLFPTPKVTLLEIKNLPNPTFQNPRFVSWGENLYVMNLSFHYPYQKIYEINLNKMEWESREKKGEEYGFFLSLLDYGALVIRAELWADLASKYERYVRPDGTGKDRLLYAHRWYFFHDCLNVNLLLHH